jgi:hypothetical protein
MTLCRALWYPAADTMNTAFRLRLTLPRFDVLNDVLILERRLNKQDQGRKM